MATNTPQREQTAEVMRAVINDGFIQRDSARVIAETLAKWHHTQLAKQEQEFRKTLNSDRKMYQAGLKDGAVKELRAIRTKYDDMEASEPAPPAQIPPETHVGWQAWKGIRNVITDRIEELTGGRQ